MFIFELNLYFNHEVFFTLVLTAFIGCFFISCILGKKFSNIRVMFKKLYLYPVSIAGNKTEDRFGKEGLVIETALNI